MLRDIKLLSLGTRVQEDLELLELPESHKEWRRWEWVVECNLHHSRLLLDLPSLITFTRLISSHSLLTLPNLNWPLLLLFCLQM